MSWYQKGKTNLDFLEQETVCGSGNSWAICTFAPHPRQVTMPAPHHSGFLQARCPSCNPTISIKVVHSLIVTSVPACVFHVSMWLGGLAARAFDLRLNGREFNSLAALLSSDSGQVTHTCWPSRSQWSSAGVPGCGVRDRCQCAYHDNYCDTQSSARAAAPFLQCLG